MKLHHILTILLSVFFIAACSDKDKTEPAGSYPEIVSPKANAIFYPDELIEMKLSDSLSSNIEYQISIFDDSFSREKLKQHFDTLKSVMPFPVGGEKWMQHESLSDKIVFAFRVRYKRNKIVTPWSPIHVFAVFPYSELITKDVNFTAHFDFIAQESGQYYSGILKSVNEIDLRDILSQNGIDTTKLAFIKPLSGKLLDKSSYSNHLDRFVFGFPGKEKGAFPFIVLGDAYGVLNKPPVTLYPYGGRYRNMYKELGNSPTAMEGAYFLNKYQDSQGKRHMVDVDLVFRCFEKKVDQLEFK